MEKVKGATNYYNASISFKEKPSTEDIEKAFTKLQLEVMSYVNKKYKNVNLIHIETLFSNDIAIVKATITG